MTRREWLTLTGLALAGGCGPRRGTGYPGYALIATAGDNSVSAVDLTAFNLVKTVQLNAAPSGIVRRTTPGLNYVLTPTSGSVHILDGNLAIIGSRRLADELTAIRLMADGKRLVAISGHARELLEIDAGNLAVINRHRLNSDPVYLEISATGCVAVSSGQHGTVELVDMMNRQHYETHLEGPVGQLRFRGDGKLLLAAKLGDHALTALTVPDLQVIADLALAMKPENLCFNFDQGQLFVSGAGMDAVAIVFPYNMLEVDQTVLAGRQPGVMACSANPRYLFVASDSGSDICILNIDSRKVIGLAQVGQNPSYITVTPDSQYALVLDETSGDMAVIHIPAIRSSHSKSGGLPAWASVSTSLFTMLPVGDKPVEAVVVPRSA
jgi:DNA-binding beta-propeller fold protein YncE